MSQDPAFLFYPGDYLQDTQCLSEKAQVSYDRIMCAHMKNICVSQKQFNFFTKRLSEDEKSELSMVLDEFEGRYIIPWVHASLTKRRAYSESRRKNRASKVDKTSKDMKNMCSHMENENEIEIEDVNKTKTKTKNNFLSVFDEIRIKYYGTKRGLETEYKDFIKTHNPTNELFDEIKNGLDKQISWRKSQSKSNEFVPSWKNFKTWLNQNCWEEIQSKNINTSNPKKIINQNPPKSELFK